LAHSFICVAVAEENGNQSAVFFTLEQLLATYYVCIWLSAKWWGPCGCDT